jgi:hypothetical protein
MLRAEFLAKRIAVEIFRKWIEAAPIPHTLERAQVHVRGLGMHRRGDV